MSKHQHILLSLDEGDFFVTLHAHKRMAQKNITHSDIQSCGRTRTISETTRSKFEITGNDCDSEDITLICVDGNGVLIIFISLTFQ